MGITVQKFGGTSVDQMGMVKGIVEAEVKRGNVVVPVVSAFSGETNKLIAIAEKIQKDPDALIQQNFIKLFQEIVVGTVQRAEKYLHEQGIGTEQKGQVLNEIEEFLWRKVLSVHEEIDQFLTSSHGSEISHPFPEDRIIGLGEVFSAHVLARTFSVRNDIGRLFLDVDTANIWGVDDVPNIFVPGSHGVIDERQLHTVLSGEIANRVTHVNAHGAVPIVPGYAGYVPGGIIDLFGRGYSDAELALTAKGLKHTIGRDQRVEAQIWKEGDGLRSADPRLVENTRLYEIVDRNEAAELSAAGMQAVNPNANRVLDAERDIDISVKSTTNPDAPGTLITAQEDLKNPGIRFITGKKGQTTFSVSSALMVDQDGVAADILDVCKRAGISIDAITTSECALVFSMDQKDADNEHLLASLQKYGTVERQDNMALVCCIGNSMADKKGLLAWLSGILAAEGINIAFDGGDGKRNITFIIEDKDFESAVRALHKGYFSPDEVSVRKVVRALVENFAPEHIGLIK